VVAADEGWMPQSEEHLAVLDLLGVRRGIVALTRVDLVDEDLADLAELEVREQLAETTLAGAPIVRVAAPAGLGVDVVGRELAAALGDVTPPDSGRARMWIDRSFTIGGAGTVVTGTLLDGRVGVGDGLAVWPDARPVRVRSIQSHEQPRDTVRPGSRVALNVVGLDRDEVPRGAMLGRPDDWRPTRRFTADLRTVRRLTDPLRDRGAFHLHVGSGAFPARLRLLEAPTLEGTGAALIEPDQLLPLKVGDRFILREVGRRAVVAGGRVLDPHPPRRGAAVRESLPILRAAGLTADERATALLQVRSRSPLEVLAADSGGGRPQGALEAGGEALAAPRVRALQEAAGVSLERFHDDHPLRPGMPKPSLAESFDISLPVLEALLDGDDRLVDDGATVRLSSFSGGMDEAAREASREAILRLREAGWAVPRRAELELDQEILHAMIRSGDLVTVSDEFVYPPETTKRLVAAVAELADGFTVAEFRDALGITRKHAIPLLEWLDRTGVTRREGDGRVVRRQPPGEPAPGGAPSP
jgi:selenocysteine-specific elongation factor